MASVSDDALKTGAGDAHVLRRLDLGQPFSVGEAQGLQFLLEQRDVAQPVQGAPVGL